MISNLDVDRLGALADASHGLRHCESCARTSRQSTRDAGGYTPCAAPGGLLVLLVPDRHKTFDRNRFPTPLSHLVDEYDRDVREVDDDHILDFLTGTCGPEDDRPEEAFTSAAMAQEIALHRSRSVHAHVWNIDEFSEVLDYGTNALGVRWNVVDTMAPGARVPTATNSVGCFRKWATELRLVGDA